MLFNICKTFLNYTEEVLSFLFFQNRIFKAFINLKNTRYVSSGAELLYEGVDRNKLKLRRISLVMACKLRRSKVVADVSKLNNTVGSNVFYF